MASLCQHPEVHPPLCPTGPRSAQESMGMSPRQPGRRAAAGTDHPGQQHDLQRDGRVVRPRGAPPQTRGGQAPSDQAAAPALGKRALAYSTRCPPQLMDSHAVPGGPKSHGSGWLRRVPQHACPSRESLFTLPIAQCVLTLCAYKHGRQTGRGEGHQRRGEARQGKPCLLPPRSAADRSPFSNQDRPIWARSWEQP